MTPKTENPLDVLRDTLAWINKWSDALANYQDQREVEEEADLKARIRSVLTSSEALVDGPNGLRALVERLRKEATEHRQRAKQYTGDYLSRYQLNGRAEGKEIAADRIIESLYQTEGE